MSAQGRRLSVAKQGEAGGEFSPGARQGMSTALRRAALCGGLKGRSFKGSRPPFIVARGAVYAPVFPRPRPPPPVAPPPPIAVHPRFRQFRGKGRGETN